MEKLTKCTCGSPDFFVTESILWKAFIDEDGEMNCNMKDGNIEAITCHACGKEYKEEDFGVINFN